MNNVVYREFGQYEAYLPDYDQGTYFMASEDSFGAWKVRIKNDLSDRMLDRVEIFWLQKMRWVRAEAHSELFDRVPPENVHKAVELADNLFIAFGLKVSR